MDEHDPIKRFQRLYSEVLQAGLKNPEALHDHFAFPVDVAGGRRSLLRLQEPVVQERRGLPTISPDGRLVLSEPAGLRGLVVMSGCGVGGIDRSPGAGRIVADIVCQRQPWIDPSVLSADRFGDSYAIDADLRAQCEQIYAHHYHEVY